MARATRARWSRAVCSWRCPARTRDGHDFVPAVTAAGVTVSLTTRPIDGCPCIVVPDTQVALGELARYVVAQLPDLTVIGLTGSQGKTSTKDLIAQLVAPYGPTVAPVGSFNNEIGHPLTALKADLTTRFLVAEMGARHVGDINYLCRITPPKVGLVLNVGHSHIGEFGSQDAIAQAKGEMIDNVVAGGTAVLNADDPRVAAMAIADRADRRRCGEAPGRRRPGDRDQARRDRPAGLHPARSTARSIAVQLQLIGEHQVPNALAAAAAVQAAGLTPEQIADGLNAATPVSQGADGGHPSGRTASRSSTTPTTPTPTRSGPRSRRWSRSGGPGGRGPGRCSARCSSWATPRTEEHDGVGRLAVRLDVNRLVAVGEGARPIHLGASLEGSWGNESAYVADHRRTRWSCSAPNCSRVTWCW